MTKGIIICHGKLAFELIQAAERILGNVDHVLTFSNDQMSPQALYAEVSGTIRKDEELLILVDLRGGNCWRIGKMIEQEFPRAKVVSGVNLPMVISFVTKRESLAFEELVATVEKDGHRGIALD